MTHVSFAVQIERFGVDEAGDGRKEKRHGLEIYKPDSVPDISSLCQQ